jgi:WD40 repeat protein
LDEQVKPFQQALRELALVPDCFVVLTVRADFYADLMASPLWPEIETHRAEVLPLDEDGLREAIVKPAEAKDVRVFLDKALVQQLISDAAGEPGILPFVQETLVLLWEKIERRYLPLSAYNELVLSARHYQKLKDVRVTGLQVAMAEHAEAVLEDLMPEQQTIARRILLRLVQFGEGRLDTRRQQPVSALRSSGDDPKFFAQTLRHLADHRLLTLSGEEGDTDQQADLAHEALISGWPTFRGWLAERREVEQARRRLEAKVEEWVGRGEGHSGLLDAVELREAERWMKRPDAAELGDIEALPELVEASRMARLESLVLRVGIISAIIALIIAVLAAVAIGQSQLASQRLEAKRTADTLAESGAVALATAEARGTQVVAVLQTVEVERDRAEQLAAAEAAARAEADVRRVEAASSLATAEAERNRAEQQARVAKSRELAAYAENTIDQDPELAVLLGLEAIYQTHYSKPGTMTAEASSALYRAMAHSPGQPTLLKGHTGDVNYASWSSDGTRIATASEDGTARIWDVKTGADLLTLSGHKGQVVYAAWSSDDTRLVTTGKDEIAIVWDAQTGAMLLNLTGHSGPVWHAAWNLDDTRIVTAGEDGTARVWDAQTGDELISLRGHYGKVVCATWNPDGTRIATSGWDHTIRVWDAQTGTEVLSLGQEGGGRVSWNPDGTQILAAYHNTRIWDAQNGTELFEFEGEPDLVQNAVWNPDGTRILTFSLGGAKVRDAEDGTTVLRLPGSPAVWNSAGTRIVTKPLPGEAFGLKVWDVQTGAELFTLGRRHHIFSLSLRQIAWNAKDTHILVNDDGLVTVWDLSGLGADPFTLFTLSWPMEAQIPEAPRPSVHVHAAWNSTGTRILTVGGISPTVWDVETGVALFTLKGHDGRVLHGAWSPDDTRIATVSEDEDVKVWDSQTGAELFSLSGHTSWVTHVAWDPAGTRIVTASRDGTAKVWDAQTGVQLFTLGEQVPRTVVARDISGAELYTVGAQSYEILQVAWGPAGTQILTAGRDRDGTDVVRIWDAQTGAELFTLSGQTNKAWQAAWNPAGTRIVTVSSDNTAKVWDARSGFELFTLSGHTNKVWQAAWDPAGTRIVTVSEDGTAQLWDARTGARLYTFMGHNGGVYSVEWNSDGTRIVTTSTDRTAKVWDARAGKELFSLIERDRSVLSTAWNSDNTRILTVSLGAQHAVEVWSVRIHFAKIYGADSLIEFACTRTERNLSQDEWERFLGADVPYRVTCPNLPADLPPKPTLLPTPTLAPTSTPTPTMTITSLSFASPLPTPTPSKSD